MRILPIWGREALFMDIRRLCSRFSYLCVLLCVSYPSIVFHDSLPLECYNE